MEELRFRNALCAVLYVACFASVCVILGAGICIILTCFFEHSKSLYECLLIFGSTLICVWIIAFLSIILSRTVIVTSEEIKLCRGKKVKWRIKKEDIQECIYNAMKWYYFLVPISTINSFTLQFKMKEKMKISKEYCALSLRQVKKMQEIFNYPIREIQTVYEQ